MSIFTDFQKGSGGSYKFDKVANEWVRVGNSVIIPFAGLNGPVWFPKGGTKYFDRALNRTFYSKQEKIQ